LRNFCNFFPFHLKSLLNQEHYHSAYMTVKAVRTAAQTQTHLLTYLLTKLTTVY